PQVYTDTTNVPTNRPAGSLLNNPDWNNANTNDYMNFGNSFYWTRQQFANVSGAFLASGPHYDYTKLSTNDYFNARLRHWNADLGLGQINNLGMERLPSPDHVATGKMIWYDYPGKFDLSPYRYSGTTAFPSLILQVLPDGNNQYTQCIYDQWGNPTNV